MIDYLAEEVLAQQPPEVHDFLCQTAIMDRLTAPLSFSFSMAGVWLWLGIALLLSTLASLIPARNASRLTVREVLAYE